MLVTNLNGTSTNPERETGPRPSAPPPPVGDPRAEREVQTGRRSGRGGARIRPRGPEREDAPSATAASTKGEALQALVATLGEERARLAYDDKLRRMIVEILDPRTGDVIARFPPEHLVEQLSSLAANNKSEDDAAPVEGLSELIGAAGGGATGRVLDELV